MCFVSLVPGISCRVYRSTVQQFANHKNGIERETSHVPDANNQVKNDKSEAIIVYECKSCLEVRKYPVKGYKQLFHDTAPSKTLILD